MLPTSALRSRRFPSPCWPNNALCLAPMNEVSMLTGYANPVETYIADPNQDVVYGLGFFSLGAEPVVIQVPDFADRFWTLPDIRREDRPD
jgi:hypothetical protein